VSERPIAEMNSRLRRRRRSAAYARQDAEGSESSSAVRENPAGRHPLVAAICHGGWIPYFGPESIAACASTGSPVKDDLVNAGDNLGRTPRRHRPHLSEAARRYDCRDLPGDLKGWEQK